MASSSSNGATNGKSASSQSDSASTAQVTSIEDLYKYFGILADAKQDAGKVSLFI